ncbi:MAG: sulfatase-like hydrolase/transferase [Akkermansia sp.]|nr:sulfatase-like hydrolase/transferase [Akkermansia sp.]
MLRHLLYLLALSMPLVAAEKPRAIVIFYTDDLGYNDTSTYGCEKVPCPNLDKLAAEGLRFTDAHSTHSVCTPSRYSLLTGEYAWRRPGTGILPGDAKLILPTTTERATLPSLMQKAGYRTAAIGKWHLGLGRGQKPTDWNHAITPGPNEVGFDYSFILAATGDRVPCIYLRNGHVVGLDPADPIYVSYKAPFAGEPLGSTHPQLLKPHARSNGPQHNCTIIDGIPRIGYMKGGKAALWKDQDMADRLTDEAISFIAESARMDKPIFLYFATNDIHVPRDPHKRFIGKSGMGIRGDVTLQMDDCLGRLRAALAQHGYSDCLFIFSSDNGPVINDGYFDGSIRDCKGHNPVAPMSAGKWRGGKLTGGKYGIMEGSTRVPFIVSWPGRTGSGDSTALISQVDIARSLAELAGAEVPTGALPDSRNQLPALLGQDTTGAPHIVESNNGGTLALRCAQYKYYRSGSTDHLYDLSTDLQEKHNIAAEHPELTRQMSQQLKQLRNNGK